MSDVKYSVVMSKKRTPAQIAADKLRTGRPKVPETKKKQYRVTIRMDSKAYRQLTREAHQRGLPISRILLSAWQESREE